MIRAIGRVQGNVVILLEPCDLPEGQLVTVEIHPAASDEELKAESLQALEAAWDNPQDAVYDNWKALYGVQHG